MAKVVHNGSGPYGIETNVNGIIEVSWFMTEAERNRYLKELRDMGTPGLKKVHRMH